MLKFAYCLLMAYCLMQGPILLGQNVATKTRELPNDVPPAQKTVTSDHSVSKGLEDGVQIKIDNTFFVAKNLPPDKVDLGEVFTGTKHFAVLEFANATNEAFTIAKIETSCGCIVGYTKNAILKPNEKTELVIILEAQTTPTEIARKVTVKTDTGIGWQLMVSAKVLPRYELFPTRLPVTDSEHDVEFTLKGASSIDKFSGLSLRSLTSYIALPELLIKGDESVFHFKGRLTQDARTTLGVVIERLVLTERKTGEVLQEFHVAIEQKTGIATRPSTLVVEERNGRQFATFLLLGSPEKIDSIPAMVTFEVLRQGKKAFSCEAAEISRSRAAIHFCVEFSALELEELKSSKGLVTARVLDNESFICEFREVRF